MHTPTTGVPIWVQHQMEALRKELRDHTSKDEVAFKSINGAQVELQVETGKQTVMIANIERGLQRANIIEDKRKTTEIELQGNTRGWIRKAVIGVIAAAVGAAIHWIAS